MDREVIRFVEAAGRVNNVSALNEAFVATLRRYGIGSFAAAVLDPVKLRPDHFLASNYRSEWIDHYTRESYEKVDPVVLRSLGQDEPFTWSANVAPKPARRLFDEAAEAGLVSGFAVPIRLRNGRRSVVSVASDLRSGEFERLMDHARPSVQTAIYCYHDTLCEMAGLGAPRAEPMPRLEADVLTWLAAGIGTARIAEAMVMPECSVEAHIANAMRRLGLTSRDHLAAEAVRRGYLPNF